MEFDLENPLTGLNEHQPDAISDLFASESDHMPPRNFLQCCKTISEFYVSFRQEAISHILQAQYCCKHDPVISYLAVNYMDRFISRQEIPQGKPWVLRLVVISCLSLAAKMKDTDFSVSDLQAEEGFIFDAQTINRMEFLILDTLDWRMRSITPFAFVRFFVSSSELKDPPLAQALKGRAIEIIFKAHNEIKLLDFKPSIISASALLIASNELFPLQFRSFNRSISSCQYVNKEKLLKCFNALQEMLDMERCYESMMHDGIMSCTRTPISVLDHSHYGTTSEESETTSIITTISSNAATALPAVKRQKLNGFYGN